MEDFSQNQIVSLYFSLIFNWTIKFAESLAGRVPVSGVSSGQCHDITVRA